MPGGYRLHEYRIARILGAGGFGITYLAHDTYLNKPCAIKEYLPKEFALRADGSTVLPLSESRNEEFNWGLERFLDEARVMAQFSHPNLVGISRFFAENGTAYIVMDYVEGESLTTFLNREAPLTESALRRILEPLLDALAMMHAEGVLHRDIKPDNIVLCEDGRPVLLDFGSARIALGELSHTLTAILTPGYAPVEQYSDGRTAKSRQGPYTDIYALGAIAYRALTGEKPQDATERILDDQMPRLSDGEHPGASQLFLSGVDDSLLLRPTERPASIESWIAMLGWTDLVDPDGEQSFSQIGINEQPSETQISPDPSAGATAEPQESMLRIVASSLAVLLLVLGVLVFIPLPGDSDVSDERPLSADSNVAGDRGSATAIATHSDTAGKLEAGDENYFRIDVSEGGSLEVFSTGNIDTRGALLDGNGTELVSDDDGAANLNFLIAHDVSAGTYFVLVEGFSSDIAGDYNLHTRFVDEELALLANVARQGDAESQFYMGVNYELGDGVPQDLLEAARWYRLAAEQGSRAAQFNLGNLYRIGRGVDQDATAAARWFRLAAEQGLAGAQTSLGVLYERGQGVAEDAVEAARWYRLAAEQGYARAQSALGFLYYSGRGVAEDAVEAARLFRLAAEQGNAVAQTNLGVLYERGQGVPEDASEAARWYRLAAEQGLAGAQTNLGFLYENGLGVPEDASEAARWYRLAAEQGDVRAQELINSMIATGSHSQ
ncbi:MAG: protein kinase [Aestuariivita sp.]|nr:protein kinase [Aestuariivita sp.]